MNAWTFQVPEETRECNKCKETQPLSQFSIDKNLKGGRKYICRTCIAKQVNAAKAAARAKVRAAPPPITSTVKYEPYRPVKELGYVIRNDGLKHIPSRGF